MPLIIIQHPIVTVVVEMYHVACNQPAKFVDCNHCVSGHIRDLICHMTLKNHVIKGSSDLMEVSSSLCVTALPGVMGIGIVLV